MSTNITISGRAPVIDASAWLVPNATILNGAVIGEGSLIAANALVLEGTVVPPRSLVAGSRPRSGAN